GIAHTSHSTHVLPCKNIEVEGLFLSFPFSASILAPPPLLTIGHLHLLSPLLLFSFIVVYSTATHLKFGRPVNAAIFAPRFSSPLRLFSILHFGEVYSCFLSQVSVLYTNFTVNGTTTPHREHAEPDFLNGSRQSLHTSMLNLVTSVAAYPIQQQMLLFVDAL
ncbi:hypothetical protein H5410_020512, partial [Solanum commersonii]